MKIYLNLFAGFLLSAAGFFTSAQAMDVFEHDMIPLHARPSNVPQVEDTVIISVVAPFFAPQHIDELLTSNFLHTSVDASKDVYSKNWWDGKIIGEEMFKQASAGAVDEATHTFLLDYNAYRRAAGIGKCMMEGDWSYFSCNGSLIVRDILAKIPVVQHHRVKFLLSDTMRFNQEKEDEICNTPRPSHALECVQAANGFQKAMDCDAHVMLAIIPVRSYGNTEELLKKAKEKGICVFCEETYSSTSADYKPLVDALLNSEIVQKKLSNLPLPH